MLGLLVGAAWLVALQAWLRTHLLINADALSVADVWASLKAGSHLGDWSMGNHAFVFPDLCIYQVAAWFKTGLVERQVAYGVIQGFFAWWFGAQLLKRLFQLRSGEARAFAAAGLLGALPFVKAESGLGHWFFPAHHGGVILASLALLAWVLKQDSRPSGWFKVLLVGVLCSLVHASDAVFATWAFLPALCLSLPLEWRGRLRVWAALLFSFAFKTLWIAHWKAQGLRLLHFKWDYYFAHWHELLAKAGQEAMAFAGAYGFVLGLAALLALGFLLAWKRQPFLACLGLAWFVMLGVGLSLAVLQGQLTGRYLTWCLWVPAIVAPAALARLWPSLRGLMVLVPTATGLLWLLLWNPAQAMPVPEPQRQAAWLDAQLQVRGLQRGWANYWQARPLRLFSQRGVQLLPVITEWGPLQRFEWVSQRQTFDGDPDLKHPQFVVMNGLDPAKVEERLGSKGQALEGEGLNVWFYGPQGPLQKKRNR